MAPPHIAAAVQKEGRVSLAVHSLKQNQISSQRKAEDVYKAPRTTIRRRLQGIPERLGTRSKFRLLLECEEAALVKWVASLEQRGYLPAIIDIHRMAQTFLTKRGSTKTPGKNWRYKLAIIVISLC